MDKGCLIDAFILLNKQRPLFQLEVRGASYLFDKFQDFNSILVQLEGIDRGVEHRHHAVFQFHIGAIRSQSRNLRNNPPIQFQFHIGAIRRFNQDPETFIAHNYFNSILVQLEASAATFWRGDGTISIPYWCN